MNKTMMLIPLFLLACNTAPPPGVTVSQPAPSVVYVQVPAPVPTPVAPVPTLTAIPTAQYAKQAPQPEEVPMPHGNWGLAQPSSQPSARALHSKPCGMTSCAIEDQCCAEGTLHMHSCYPKAYVCQRFVR